MEARIPTTSSRELGRNSEAAGKTYLQTLSPRALPMPPVLCLSWDIEQSTEGQRNWGRKRWPIEDSQRIGLLKFHPKENGNPLKDFNQGSEVVKLGHLGLFCYRFCEKTIAFKFTFSYC